MRLRDEVRHDARDALRSDSSAAEHRGELHSTVRSLWQIALTCLTIVVLGGLLDLVGLL